MRILIFSIMALLISATPATAFWGDKDKSKMDLSEVVKGTHDDVLDIKKLTIAEVVDRIKEYTTKTTEFKEDLKSKKLIFFNKSKQDRIDITYDYIVDMAAFFKEAHDERDWLKKELYKKISEIKGWEIAVNKKISKEMKYLDSLQTELGNVNNEIVDAQKKTAKITSLKDRISLAKDRISMLQEFSKFYVQMQPKLFKAADSVDRFSFTVEQAYYVYRDAAKTLKMHKDIDEAIKQFNKFTSLDSVASSIVTNMDDVTAIVDKLLEESRHFAN